MSRTLCIDSWISVSRAPPWQAGPQLKLWLPDKGFQCSQPTTAASLSTLFHSHSRFDPPRSQLLLCEVFVCTAVYTLWIYLPDTADTFIKTECFSNNVFVLLGEVSTIVGTYSATDSC